ncbi:flagellar assembly protein FliH [Halobacillus sp. Nhm2S1]|uniref:flagellar assembly protein FliH n=1 Tax=Halobacillus sp. Nhm2S1 TaxID=2866716 RepID=UPI001C731501|nr:flagellar assembly protein FliH [Halobacillus sp. Nhm2S1]MBX0356447.1 flagellar assembly protein FliH [Halobacillus sp. Nhm2S1]
MTSLSKHGPSSSGRIIGLRPVHIRETHVQENEQEQKSHQINQELAQAQKELEVARIQREQLIRSTEEEIQSMKETWEEERKVIENEAYQKGVDQGFRKGHKEGHEALEDRLSQANKIIQQAKAAHDRMVTNSERTIIEVAMKTSEKILNAKLEEDPTLFSPVVKRVIEEVKGQPEVALYVHPEKYEFVYKQSDELERLITPSSYLSIYAEEELTPNACIVESQFGRLDGSIDTQLSELRHQLLSVANEEMGNE